MTDIDVLLCYRGRYQRQIERLDALLEAHHLRVTYDAEILSAGDAYEEAEIEWLPLGSTDDDSGATAWRGPLSAAVARSALVVFLIDPHDPSVNVMNEIAWAARSGRPLFVIFATRADSHSEEWEGINVGMLQAFYGSVTGRPESPTFGYHFLTHTQDEALDERLTILVNRLVSYLGTVRRGEVDKVRLDKDTTLSDVENAPQARARRRLHAVQERIAKAVGIASPPVEGDPLQETLAQLYARERDGQVRNGRIFPRSSPFSYPEHSERERYRRTESLVTYIRPGPFENPIYLAMLARELVSVEMTIPRPIVQPLMIGTVAYCPSNVPVDVVLEPDYALLLVDATFVDHAYQMLKAAVLSWKITTPPGVVPVGMSTRIEDTRDVIAGDPARVAGFAASLRAMLERGRPGSSTDGTPAAAYHPALTMLGVFQKRFVIATAVARIAVLIAAREAVRTPAGEQSASSDAVLTPERWVHAADALASRWVFDGARMLDGVDPTIALQGMLMGLASQELLERSLPAGAMAEVVSARSRAPAVGDAFLAYNRELGMADDEAADRRNAAERAAASLDLLWRAATVAGELDATNIQPAGRWRR
jgi:hypothetical protein